MSITIREKIKFIIKEGEPQSSLAKIESIFMRVSRRKKDVVFNKGQ
jgi:hypothetical protein